MKITIPVPFLCSAQFPFLLVLGSVASLHSSLSYSYPVLQRELLYIFRGDTE